MELAQLIGPAVTAAVVAGAISFGVAYYNRREDRKKAFSDNAWEDYGVRRDAYIELAHFADSLFQNGDAAKRPDFHRAARKVRLLGSDDVVRALNAFTNAAKTDDPEGEALFQELYSVIRRDIRSLQRQPPEGTELHSKDFPLEG